MAPFSQPTNPSHHFPSGRIQTLTCHPFANYRSSVRYEFGLSPSSVRCPPPETIPTYYYRVNSLRGVARSEAIRFKECDGPYGPLLLTWEFFRGPQTLAELAALQVVEAGVSLEATLGPDFASLVRSALCGHPFQEKFDAVETLLTSLPLDEKGGVMYYRSTTESSGFWDFWGNYAAPTCWEFNTRTPTAFVCCVRATQTKL